METKLTKAGFRPIEAHRDRALARELLRNTDHILKDIGLERADNEASIGLSHSPGALELASSLYARRC